MYLDIIAKKNLLRNNTSNEDSIQSYFNCFPMSSEVSVFPWYGSCEEILMAVSQVFPVICHFYSKVILYPKG